MLNHRDCALASAFIFPPHFSLASSINSYSALIKSETFKASTSWPNSNQHLSIIITITDIQLLRLNVLITIGQKLIASIIINHHPLHTDSLEL